MSAKSATSSTCSPADCEGELSAASEVRTGASTQVSLEPPPREEFTIISPRGSATRVSPPGSTQMPSPLLRAKGRRST